MKRVFRFLTGIIIAGSSSACAAMSSLGDAIVLEANGLPCFTIENNSKTKDGLPLSNLLVSELTVRDGERFPDELWSFSTKASNPITISPRDCIRYGDVPTSAEHHPAKPLIPYHVYAVGIGARPKGAGVLAYVSEFCIKPSADNNITIQVIPRKMRNGKRQYDLCANPTIDHDGVR